MDINEYQRECLRTAKGMTNFVILTENHVNSNNDRIDINYPMLLNGLMGLNGEAGECIDIYKKHLFQDHELNKEHLAKELGDVAWYLAVSASALGYDLEDIFRMNVEKLRVRYPDGFDPELSKHRKENDI